MTNIKLKKLCVVLLVLLFLNGCGDEHQKEIFEFADFSEVPIIEVTINGRLGRLVVDSGAAVSSLDSKYARYFGFQDSIGGEEEILTGIGGSVTMRNIDSVVVYYKELRINHGFKTSSLGEMYRLTGAVGVLGADYLMKEKLIIDFKSNSIRK